MGWTRYDAHCYNPNGKVDRKAECDRLFNWSEPYNNTSLNVSGQRTVEVVKSVMVGSTYYAALRVTHEREEENGKKTIHKSVFGMVCLTAGRSRWDGYDFGVKEIEETCGPNASRCPESILKLLDAPHNDFAQNWRTRCHEYNERQKQKRKTRAAA